MAGTTAGLSTTLRFGQDDESGLNVVGLAVAPGAIEAPGGDGAVVHDAAVEEHGLELVHGDAVDGHVVFFRVAVCGAGGEVFGEKGVVELVHDAVTDPELAELGDAAGGEACFFLEFAAGHLFGVGVGVFPATLGEFEIGALDGVAKLADEPEEIAFGGVFERDDDGGGVFVDDAIDAALAVGALDDVFANAGPGVTVDLACGDGFDRHTLAMVTSPQGKCRTLRGARRDRF